MRPVVALCAIGVVGCATACSRPQAQSRSSAVPTVAVAKVARGDVSRVLTVAAEFRPYQEIDLHAKVAGFVKSIEVDVGDRVKAGQLIAVLEVPELQNDLQQDEASVLRATEEVNRAGADLERAQSAHEMAHLGAERLISASQARPNLVARQDIDEAAGRDRVAEAQVSTAKAALASARQQLEMTRASQARTRTLFAYARITAPFAGVITHRYADTGAMIQAGTSSQTQTMPLVKLSQNDRLRLIISVPESAVSRIHDRQPVDVRVQALDTIFPGTVARFAQRLDADTRTMRVEVDVPNPKLALVPGMYAQASMALDRATGALTLPVQAVDRLGGKPRVVIVNHDSRIEVRDVELGLESADRVVVRAGLEAGELVVLGNRAQLKAGMSVAPREMPVASGSDGER
jgi:RND family efflux transporter MFP subunit